MTVVLCVQVGGGVTGEGVQGTGAYVLGTDGCGEEIGELDY